MSKKKSQEAYEKTFSYKFLRWMQGDNDPYIGELEMQKQEEIVIPPEDLNQRLRDRKVVINEVYDIKNNKRLIKAQRGYKILAAVCCLMFLVVLLVNVSYLPPYGNPDNPTNNVVSERYIEKGLQETGAVNIVGGMILDYRAFDTFGESNVLFIATVTVLILLRFDSKKNKKQFANARIYEPKNDPILQGAARVLVPIIFLFGIYIIMNGHLSPGGGFSGGAIIGAGLILYTNAFGFKKTEKFFTANTYKYVSFAALTFYCLAKSYSFFTGANELESHIPKGTPGNILSSGLILPLNICVGLVVACTMYTFYCMFRKGDF